MKLYTEEQVRELLSEYIKKEWVDKHISSLTPIELPSDEEIDKEINGHYQTPYYNNGFMLGAKWVIDKIKNQ